MIDYFFDDGSKSFGRVTLTAPEGDSFTWHKSKDGVNFVPMAQTTQQITDNRPTAIWKQVPVDDYNALVTLPEPAVAVAVFGSPFGDEFDDQGTSGDFYIDGVHAGDYVILPGSLEKAGWDFADDQMLWGKVGAAATVRGTDYVTRVAYATFLASYSDTIIYKCIVSGGATYTQEIDPRPDRKEAAKATIAKLLPAMVDYPAHYTGNADSPFEDLVVFAGMYLMTDDAAQRAAIYTAAAAAWNSYLAAYNPATGLITASDSTRIGYCLYFARSVFKADYPALAAAMKPVIIQVINTYIPSMSSIAPGAMNHTTPMPYACALVYSDREFADFYQAPVVAATAVGLLNLLYTAGMIGGDGAMPYYPAMGQFEPEAGYALFQWQHLKYASDVFTWEHSDKVALAATYLANQFMAQEPFVYYSPFYAGVQPVSVMQRVQACYAANGTAPTELVDLLYSAAFDMNDFTTLDPNYQLTGFPADSSIATSTIGPQNVGFFYALHGLIASGVPAPVWFVDGVVPPPPTPRPPRRLKGKRLVGKHIVN